MRYREAAGDAGALMDGYWGEFGKVAVVHLLAVVSPGPDFAIVLRQSLAHGRSTACWTSVGIGTAIFLHVTYSLLGIGLLLRGSAFAFELLKFAGAAYLCWIGVQGLRARRREFAPGAVPPAPPAAHGAFMTGFLTNALNPKAALFFVALFATVIGARTPKLIQAGYGAWMAFLTTAWFILVSIVFTRSAVRDRFLRHGHWIDRALGLVFLGFAASLVFARVR